MEGEHKNMVGGFNGAPLSGQCGKLCSGHKETPFLKKTLFVVRLFFKSLQEILKGVSLTGYASRHEKI